MAISDERKKELERLSIGVYRQIGAGYDWEKIKNQFSNDDADPEEVAWVMETGRLRYLGYQKHHQDNNKRDAKSAIFVGLGILALLAIYLSVAGFPTFGRLRGRLVLVALLGLGGVGYGLWILITSKPKGFRTDISDPQL